MSANRCKLVCYDESEPHFLVLLIHPNVFLRKQMSLWPEMFVLMYESIISIQTFATHMTQQPLPASVIVRA